MNRILFGMALCAITLNFLCLNYILPAVGTVLLLLGFRTLRRENRWLRRLLCHHCDPRGVLLCDAGPEYNDFAKCRVHARRHDRAHRCERGAAPRPVLLLLARAAGGAEKGGPARAGRRRARADRVVRARVRPRRRPLHGLDRADRHARGLRVHPPQPLPAVRRAGRGRIRHRAGAGAGNGPVRSCS